MNEYHKIQTVFKRDPKTNYKTLLAGHYSIPEFIYLRDNVWEFTEKVDGTNIRVFWDGCRVRFGGKTDNAQIPTFLYNELCNLFPSDKFNKLPPLTLYGEGYGAKIQKGGGKYKSDGVSFVLFDVMVSNWWLRKDDVIDVAKNLSIDVVPVVGVGTLDDLVRIVREGFNSHWGNFTAEGIVARPYGVDLFTRDGSRIITKLKYRDFI